MIQSKESNVHVPATAGEAFEDLVVRFLNNIPETELSKPERLFFQLEQAWWYYEDFLADKYEHLPHFPKFGDFTKAMFNGCHILQPLKQLHDSMLQQFKEYVRQIPVYGAMLLNKDMDKVLMVQSFHGKYWGFPKGKVNQDEDPLGCAVREVYEEVGFDGTDHIDPTNCIEMVSKQGKKTALYIMENVPINFDFEPQVRKEISEIRWFDIDSLPTRRDQDVGDIKFLNVHVFISKLRNWISRKRSGRQSKRPDHKKQGKSPYSKQEKNQLLRIHQDKSLGSPQTAKTKQGVRGPENTKRIRAGQAFTENLQALPRSTRDPNETLSKPPYFVLDVQEVMDAMHPFLCEFLDNKANEEVEMATRSEYLS